MFYIPGKATRPPHPAQGHRNISAIPNDVNELSIRNGWLDFRNIENVKWSVVGPTGSILLTGDTFHDNSQEISRIPAFRQN